MLGNRTCHASDSGSCMKGQHVQVEFSAQIWDVLSLLICLDFKKLNRFDHKYFC